MNVAVIIERIETWRGGAETSTMQFAEYLAADGCRVNVITTSYSPSTPSLNIVPIRVQGRLRALRTRQFISKAAAYVRANSFDVVHCITPCPAADIYQPRGDGAGDARTQSGDAGLAGAAPLEAHCAADQSQVPGDRRGGAAVVDAAAGAVGDCHFAICGRAARSALRIRSGPGAADFQRRGCGRYPAR